MKSGYITAANWPGYIYHGHSTSRLIHHMLVTSLVARLRPALLAVPAVLSCVLLGTPTYASERIAPELADLIKQFPAKGDQTEVIRKIVNITLDDHWQESTTAYYAIRIGDAEAARDYSQIRVPFSNYYENVELDFARVRSADGSVSTLAPDAVQVQTPQEDSFYQDTRQIVFSLPAIKPGAVLEFQYTRKPLRSIIENEWFTSMTPYWWEDKAGNQGMRADAVRNATLTVSAPDNKTLTISKTERPDFTFSLKKSNGRQQLVWDAKNVTPFVMEDQMPVNYGVDHFVVVSTLPGWQSVNAWAKGLIDPKLQLDDKLRQIVADIAAKATTKEEKVRGVYAYLQNNVRYIFAHVGHGGYEPHMATDVVKNAYGDCKDQSILAVTLLRALGVDAYPALVSTKGNNYLDPTVGEVDFDHMITYIPASQVPAGDAPSEKGQDTAPQWMDTTGDHSLYPGMSVQIEGQPALIINGKDARLTTIPTRSIDQHSATLGMNFSYLPSHEVQVNFTLDFSGMFEQHFRSWWIYDEDRKANFEKVLGQIYNKAEITQFSVNNADNLWQPVSISGTMKLRERWEGEPKPFNLPVSAIQLMRLFASFDNLKKPGERLTPYVNYVGYRLKLNATMPPPTQQYAPMAISAGPSVNSRYFTLKQQGDRQQSNYVVNISLDIPAGEVPLTQYADLYARINGIEQLPFWNIAFTQQANSSTNVAVTDKKTPSADALTTQLALTRYYLDHGEFQQALASAQQAVARAPQNGEAHYLLGMAQGYQGLFQESDQSFARATQLGYKL